MQCQRCPAVSSSRSVTITAAAAPRLPARHSRCPLVWNLRNGCTRAGLKPQSSNRAAATRRIDAHRTAALPRVDSSAPEFQLHSSPLALPMLLGAVPAPVIGELGDGLETPVQLLYLTTLLGFLVVGAYLVVRQVLIRRELEEAAKVLGERVRTGEAIAEDYFELGVILLRKKLYTQSTKNLEKAKKLWDGEPEELAQVHNALGFAYFNMSRYTQAIVEYKQAVSLQPGYVTAWNNLGNVCEQAKDWQAAYEAYTQALSYSPDNSVARQRSDALKSRLDRLGA